MDHATAIESCGWTKTPCCYTKTFVFENFSQAFSFITTVASFAEKQQHHPQLINTYNKVTLNLWTHDTNSITSLDENWILAFEAEQKKKAM